MLNLMRIGLLSMAAFATLSYASTDNPNSALARTQRLSSLTGPGAEPFHLRLVISEPNNPQSPYSATIEEYWKTPDDLYRSISSSGFEQRLLVKAGQRTEQNIGNYYPLWPRNFVSGAIDPLEDAAFWDKVSARIVLTTSTNGHPSGSCARAQFKIGTTNVNNDAFAVICFNADGTLSSVVRPGYDMEFHDAQAFGKKRIAYRYVNDPEPGTELVGHVVLLEKIESSFLLPDLQLVSGSPPVLIRSISVSQDTFEKLLPTPISMAWPPVQSGNTNGKLSMYVSADREGQIREAYPLNSDNAGLQDFARDQLLKIKLKPAVADGQPVQTEAALTLEFSTHLAGSTASSLTGSATPPSTSKPIIVSSSIANSLRIKVYAPVYPQDLKEKRISGKVDLTAVIGRDGRIISLTPISSTDPEFTAAALAATQQWTYKPYLLNGNPVEIQTVISVIFQAP